MSTVDTPKRGKPRRKRQRARPRDVPVSYVVEIKEWNWSFSFGLNAMPDRDGPYSDHRHLRLSGNLLRPTKIKTQNVELTLLPEPNLNEAEGEKVELKAVGALQLYRGRFTGVLSMPTDALPPVLQMIIADRFRFIVLSGERLRYGRALIRTYRLEMTIDEDDLPPDE